MSEHFSLSQLNSWTRCPEQYRLERIHHVPSIPTWATVGGTAFHAVTETNDKREHGVDTPPVTFEEAFEQATQDTEEKYSVSRADFRATGRKSAKWPDKENRDWWLVEGPSMVHRWTAWARNTSWNILILPDGAPAIEVPFDLFIGDLHIVGYVDRVFVATDGTVVVVDLKTGATKQASPRQLGVYKVGLEHKFPDLRVHWGTYFDARTGSSEAPYLLDKFDTTRAAWQFGALREAKRLGLFLANPGMSCNSCSVRDYCYEVGGELSDQIPPPWEGWKAA